MIPVLANTRFLVRLGHRASFSLHAWLVLRIRGALCLKAEALLALTYT